MYLSNSKSQNKVVQHEQKFSLAPMRIGYLMAEDRGLKKIITHKIRTLPPNGNDSSFIVNRSKLNL